MTEGGHIVKLTLLAGSKAPKCGVMVSATGFVTYDCGGLVMHDVALSPAPDAPLLATPKPWNTTMINAYNRAKHANRFSRLVVSFTAAIATAPEVMHRGHVLWLRSERNFAAVDVSSHCEDMRYERMDTVVRVTGGLRSGVRSRPHLRIFSQVQGDNDRPDARRRRGRPQQVDVDVQDAGGGFHPPPHTGRHNRRRARRAEDPLQPARPPALRGASRARAHPGEDRRAHAPRRRAPRRRLADHHRSDAPGGLLGQGPPRRKRRGRRVPGLREQDARLVPARAPGLPVGPPEPHLRGEGHDRGGHAHACAARRERRHERALHRAEGPAVGVDDTQHPLHP